MRKIYFLTFLSLSICLFIYLFYRTEKTVVNEIFISIISFEKYLELRNIISNILPLNKYIVYSLPEGLWVFSTTLNSKFLFIKIGNLKIDLVFVPIVFSIGLEIFQLLHLTNGRFDLWDIGFSVFFGLVANYLILYKSTQQNILNPFTKRSLICILSYSIVYLAHVWE